MQTLSDQLSVFLSSAQAAGMSLTQVADALSASGWTTEHVAAALHRSDADVSPEKEAQSDVISVTNLTKRYGDFTAVDGISFTVRRGEVFGILGPNGAGKTTTLEMIEGLRRPTSGEISINGLNVQTDTQAVKHIIGVQPQASTFFDGLTLVETLEMFGALYGRTVDAMELLNEVQLTEKAHQQIKELSGGQKQRFSIAVGLVNDPVVLFLDEPTTGLDPQARRNLWELVRHINARGTTVVLTTHYMDEAEYLCDRIAVMDHAHIVALDTTSALLEHHGGSAHIEFTSNAEIPAEQLASLAGVESTRFDAGFHVVATTDPRHTLDALFVMSRSDGFPIDGLMLKRSTLEDVFLRLTGRQLRD